MEKGVLPVVMKQPRTEHPDAILRGQITFAGVVRGQREAKESI